MHASGRLATASFNPPSRPPSRLSRALRSSDQYGHSKQCSRSAKSRSITPSSSGQEMVEATPHSAWAGNACRIHFLPSPASCLLATTLTDIGRMASQVHSTFIFFRLPTSSQCSMAFNPIPCRGADHGAFGEAQPQVRFSNVDIMLQTRRNTS
jgi:hypothetical protein